MSNPPIVAEAVAGTTSEHSEPRLVGDLAVWLVILIELLTFGIMFATYAFARSRHVELFNASQRSLDLNAGAINTVLLISGSWCIAHAVRAVRRNDVVHGTRWLAGALLCGGGFIAMKSTEYAAKLAEGVDLSTNDFYMFYILLTGFHFLHVVAAMVFVLILLVRTSQGAYGTHDCHALETGAAFWHMVDLLWIVLFPLVYVMR